MLFAASILLLLAFTGFLAYLAVGRYGGDCGCLGPVIDRWSGGGPIAGIVRNLVLLALLAWPALLAFRQRPAGSPRFRSAAVGSHAVVLLLASLAATPMLAPSAAAQEEESPQDLRRLPFVGPWAAGYETPLRTRFTDRLTGDIAQWFGMTDDQEAVLKSLREAHQAKFDAFVIEAASTWQPLAETMMSLPRSTLARHKAAVDYEIAVAKIADRQEALDLEFLASIRMVLDEDQIERWDEFRMWLNRVRWAHRAGWYLEQSVDLIAILQQLEQLMPDPAASVPDEIVREYARALDQALRNLAEYSIEWNRNRTRNETDRLQTDGERTWLGSWSDPDRAERLKTTRLSLNSAIRDVNHQYAEIFASHLPEPKATMWRRLYRESVLRRADYDSSLSDDTNNYIIHSFKGSQHRFGRLVEAIRKDVPDLDSEQSAAIDATVDQRNVRLNAAFRRVVSAHDEHADSSFRGVGRAERKKLEEKYLESLEALVEIERQAQRNLLAILTPEQQAAIEEPDADADD